MQNNGGCNPLTPSHPLIRNIQYGLKVKTSLLFSLPQQEKKQIGRDSKVQRLKGSAQYTKFSQQGLTAEGFSPFRSTSTSCEKPRRGFRGARRRMPFRTTPDFLHRGTQRPVEHKSRTKSLRNRPLVANVRGRQCENGGRRPPGG